MQKKSIKMKVSDAIDEIKRSKKPMPFEFIAEDLHSNMIDGINPPEQLSLQQVRAALTALAREKKIFRKTRKGRAILFSTQRPENGGIPSSRSGKNGPMDLKKIHETINQIESFQGRKKDVREHLSRIRLATKKIEDILRSI